MNDEHLLFNSIYPSSNLFINPLTFWVFVNSVVSRKENGQFLGYLQWWEGGQANLPKIVCFSFSFYNIN